LIRCVKRESNQLHRSLALIFRKKSGWRFCTSLEQGWNQFTHSVQILVRWSWCACEKRRDSGPRMQRGGNYD